MQHYAQQKKEISMTYRLIFTVAMLLLFSPSVYLAEDKEESEETKKSDIETKQAPLNKESKILGMNVRGNKESPLRLNIVPWRTPSHQRLAPKVIRGWQPELKLLQPAAYRREIRAFLQARGNPTK